MTMLMPTAIRQYSIAVAPASSFKNSAINRRIPKLLSTPKGSPRAKAWANVNLIGCLPVEEDGQ
jgi:hypothetical protein